MDSATMANSEQVYDRYGQLLSAGAGSTCCIGRCSRCWRWSRPGCCSCGPPAAERSVLCPVCPRCVRFSMRVETSHAPSPAEW